MSNSCFVFLIVNATEEATAYFDPISTLIKKMTKAGWCDHLYLPSTACWRLAGRRFSLVRCAGLRSDFSEPGSLGVFWRSRESSPDMLCGSGPGLCTCWDTVVKNKVTLPWPFWRGNVHRNVVCSPQCCVFTTVLCVCRLCFGPNT